MEENLNILKIVWNNYAIIINKDLETYLSCQNKKNFHKIFQVLVILLLDEGL